MMPLAVLRRFGHLFGAHTALDTLDLEEGEGDL